MGNWLKSKIFPKKALSNSPSEILRPLYNRNMVKLSFEEWSQNYIFAARSPFSGLPKDNLKNYKTDIFGYAKSRTSGNKKQIRRPLYDR